MLPGGRELMSRNPGRYAQLLTISNDKVDMEIMRDLNRTFPNHVFFFQRQGPGQQSLFHVLRAYSSYDQQVGVGIARGGNVERLAVKAAPLHFAPVKLVLCS
jgi:hypothetical protein